LIAVTVASSVSKASFFIAGFSCGAVAVVSLAAGVVWDCAVLSALLQPVIAMTTASKTNFF